MPDFGVTDEGFNRKRTDVILSDKNDILRGALGDNLNLSPQSPDGQVNGGYAESDGDLWALAEACYNAFNPSAAAGATLSSLVQLNGIERLSPTPSSTELTLTGTPGTNIPAGSLVGTDPITGVGELFETQALAVIGGGGTITVAAEAQNTGPIPAIANTINQISTPITGWTAATNLAAAQEGTNLEGDPSLRARRERSVARDAQGIIDSIAAAVANVDGVTTVIVPENATSSVGPGGLPPHSYGPIVVGGDNTEIADQIFLKGPAGIQSFGTTIVVVDDDQGFPHDIGFSRPVQIPIYVIVNLTADADYPADGDDLIKQAIVDYSNGLLVSGREFGLGDDVIHSRLFTPVNSVQGHSVDSMLIGIAPAPTLDDDIVIAISEISEFTVANITVVS